MNLKEHIRRILKEEVNESTFFRRRVDMRLMEKEFFDILNILTDIYLSKYNHGIDFNFETFEDHVIHYFMDGYYNDLTNGGENDYPYDEVYEFLSKHFHNKIKDRYDTHFGRNINESESKQERKFTKLLNNIQEYLNSNSYDSVVRFMVDYDEVMDDVIVNIFFDAEHAVKLGGGINSVIKRTGKKIMEDLSVFPFDFKYYTHFEKPQLNESKTSQHLKIINNLLDPFKEKDCLCDIRISFDVEDNNYNIYLVFSQEELHEKFFNLYGIRSYIQKMMNEVKMELESFIPIRNVFIGYYTKPNCEWSPLNESEDDKEKKIQKNLRAIRTLLDTIDVDGLCEMWVEYNPEDGDYEIRSKTTKRYLDMPDMVRELGFIDDTIRSWGMKTYVYTPWYVENCEDEVEFMNESEEKKGKYINALEDLTEDFKNEDCVCDIKISHKPEEFRDTYLITVVLGNRDIDDKFGGHNITRERNYKSKLKRKITDEVLEFLPIPFFVEFKQTPKCKDYKNLQESEDKKPRLLSTIEQDGLLQFMQDTGLSLPQIYTKTGELPREVLERYIKDFIKQEGYPSWKNGTVQLIFTVEIQKNIQIDQFYMEGDKVTVEISGYNDYGEQTDGYIESLSNLTDEEIFTIVENMINWFTSSEM
jgi:predicted house-cleaning noncanonical NTP pyrophosphatase (MazG superfamily)